MQKEMKHLPVISLFKKRVTCSVSFDRKNKNSFWNWQETSVYGCISVGLHSSLANRNKERFVISNAGQLFSKIYIIVIFL